MDQPDQGAEHHRAKAGDHADHEGQIESPESPMRRILKSMRRVRVLGQSKG